MSAARTTAVMESLGSQVVHGVLAPGALLLLDDVMAQHQVSRTTARDAVKLLESLRLLRPRRHLGIEVLPATEWDALARQVVRWRLDGPGRMAALREVSQLRLAIEPEAAALAARFATPGQRRAVDQAALGMQHSAGTDDEAFLAHDVALHRTLLQASGNPLFASLTHLVEEGLDARTHHHLMPDDPDRASIALHRRVAEAVATGDVERARSVMQQIVEQVADAVAQAGGYQDSPAAG